MIIQMEYEEEVRIETPNKVHKFVVTKDGYGKDWLREVQ